MSTFQFLNNNKLVDDSQTIDFPSLEIQNTFWNSQVIDTLQVSDISTSRLLAETSPVQIGRSLSLLLNINYCRFYQDSKWWYFRILSKNFINDNNTSLSLELDVMQTFMFDYNIHESFVEREHQDRLTSSYKRLYNTESEVLAYGPNYKLLNSQKIYPTNDQNSKNILNTAPLYYACITGTSWLSSKGISQYNPYSQLETIIVPFVVDNYNIGFNYRVSSTLDTTQVYNILTLSEIFSKLVRGLNNIVSVTILPYYQGSIAITSGVDTITYYLKGQGFGKITIDNTDYGIMFPQARQTISYIDSFDNPTNINILPNINNLKDIKFESKLYTYPYYYYNLTDNNFTPQLFKNEYCSNQLEFYHQTSYEGIIKDKTGIENYKLLPSATYSADENQFIRINNMELPLTSDTWINYYNNNKATVQTGILSQAAQGVVGAGLQLASGAVSGNPLSAFGAISTGISTISSITSTLQKQSDLKNSPDTVRNIGNGAQYFLSNNMIYFHFSIYQILDEYREKIFNYFYRYGYAARTFKAPDLKSRYYFNYIKTIGANIDGNIDATYLNRIKSIFDNGITIWHYRDASTWKGVENYDYENVEMNLIGG